MLVTPSDVPVVLTLLLLVLWLYLRASSHKYRSLPPGPPSHWFLGTSVPAVYPWRWYREQAQHYPHGVFTVWKGRRPLVIVASIKAADELLDRQASHTADRPRQVVADEVLSQGARSLLVGYNDRWKRMRKALHSQTQPSEARGYEPLQERLSVNVLRDILADPDEHQHAYRVYAANLVLSISCALSSDDRVRRALTNLRTDGMQRRVPFEDATIQRIIKNTRYLQNCLRPGVWLANSFPWLKHVPLTLREPRRWSRLEGDLYRSLYEDAKNGSIPCFATFLKEKQADYGLTDREIWYECGTLFQAGTDTSAAAIAVAVMAAACYPEAQRRMQKELDDVVGRERLPLVSDWAHMPYASAYVKEVLRWRTISAGGFEHATTKDLTFAGYVIPRGTAILGPHWAIQLDSGYFTESNTFMPERWLREDGSLKSDKELHAYPFGFGRRICVGMHIAQRSIFINIARILWCFDVSQDEKRPIDTLAFTNTTNSNPLRYAAIFTPRLAGVKQMIAQAEAQEC